MDKDRRGALNRDQFLEIVRQRMRLTDDEEIPTQIWQKIWHTIDSDHSAEIDFEEFVAWSQSAAFCENVVVSGPCERKIRGLAKEHNITIPDIEHIWKEYEKFDQDRSGDIDRCEFQELIRVLLRSRDVYDMPKERLDRFWCDVDADKDGTINFSEFL